MAGRTERLGGLRRRLDALTWRRIQRLSRVGCIPLLVLVTVALLFFYRFVTYQTAPPWISDYRSYAVGGRLGLSLWTLGALQLGMTWFLGLYAAATAAGSVSAGASLRPRLQIVYRRSLVYLLAVLLLRLVLLLLLALGAVYVFTDWLGIPVDVNGAIQLERTVQREPVLPLIAGGMLLVQIVFGPLLRLRGSAALGALAGALTPMPSKRLWAGLNARLGLGLVGGLSLTWGTALVEIAANLIYRPPTDPMLPSQPLPPLFSGVPSYTNTLLTICVLIIAGVGVYLAGQIILPFLYTALARRRLQRRPAPPVPPAEQPL
ncbi:MAG TPA: hypothetical protein VKY39_06340 [Aggregatilineales bacterium]|nr:hypothetical protein [Aggregatilineales bacterium]